MAWTVRDAVADQRALVAIVATNKSRALEAWLAERVSSAGLSGTSFPQAELFERWLDGGDETVRDRLFLRLQQFADAGDFPNVALLAPSSEVLWSAQPLVDDVGTWTRAAWPSGAIPGAVTLLDVDWREPNDTMLAVAVALPTRQGTPAPVVVYLETVDDVVSDELRRLSVPLSTARIGVFRSTDAGLVGVSGPAEGRGAPVEAWQRLWADSDAPSVRLAQGTARPLEPVAGVDERGVSVVAAGRPVGDMGWYFIAQRNRAAVWAGAPAMIVTGSAIAVLLYVAGLVVWTGVRRRHFAEATRTIAVAEASRVRAQKLLGAVANASPDAIFAKDLEGRYLLFNRAASEFVGRAAEEMLGRDDSALFPPEQAAVVMENERRVVREERVIAFEESVETAVGERVFLATKGPLYAADGQLIGTYGISRDVTERVCMERANEAQARELAQTVDDLERFNRVLVDRELAMIELKRRLNAATRELGRPEPYVLPTSDDDGDEDEKHGRGSRPR